MFIFSFKASTLKFLGILGISVITLVALILFIPSNSNATTQEIATMNENISFNNVKNTNDPCKNVTRVPFFYFFILQAQPAGHAPQFPPQEQEGLPFFLFIIIITTTKAKSAAMTDAITAVRITFIFYTFLFVPFRLGSLRRRR